MKRLAVLALACLPATPSLAEAVHLNGMAEEILASEWADPTTVDDYLFEPIIFDDETHLVLDEALLAVVQSTFGGTPQTEEIFEGTPVTWLCYDTGGARTTFAALRVEAEPILGVIVEETGAPANPACSANPSAAEPLPGNRIPGLGATRADLQARFGSAPVDAGGHLAYVTQYEDGVEERWIERKTIYYRLENDVVTGVAYKRTTDR